MAQTTKLILDSSVDRRSFISMCFKTKRYSVSRSYLLDEPAYLFDCTFFRLICLTAKALRRVTMCGFLVGATEPEKHTLKRIQLRIQG